MRKITRRVIVIIGGIIAGVLLIAAACQADQSSSTGSAPSPTPSPVLPSSGEIYYPGDTIPRYDVPTVTIIVPPSTTTPTTSSGPATTVSDGTYEVGTDMAAGTYKAHCPAWGYWARLKHNDGSVGDIIANNIVGKNGGSMTFTAKVGEYVEIRNCTFTKIP